MGKRVLSALVFVPVVLFLAYSGGIYTALLTALLSLLALREFLGLAPKLGVQSWPGVTFGAAAVWLVLIFRGGSELLAPGVVVWFLVAAGRLAVGYPRQRPQDAAYNFVAVVYTVMLFAHLYLLRLLPHGLAWTLGVFFVVWATDTCAFLVGMVFGRHSLAPEVSPKKSVEGAIGGLVGSAAVGLLGWHYIHGLSWESYLALALAAGVSAQVGDLAESALKRSAGVKDSGHLIPGHGGILDRFDSFLFALPLVYYSVVIYGL